MVLLLGWPRLRRLRHHRPVADAPPPFGEQLRDDRSGLAVDGRPGEALLIAFSGLAQGLGMPVFEFREITRRVADAGFVFARDLRRSWYHRGIEGISGDIDG